MDSPGITQVPPLEIWLYMVWGITRAMGVFTLPQVILVGSQSWEPLGES